VNPAEVNAFQEPMSLQRKAAVSELARGMGHDFNNLLQGVLGAISVVKLSTPPTHQLYAILDLAERSAHQARELGRRLIYLARGDLAMNHVGDLGPLLRVAVEAGLRGTAVTCRFDLAEGLDVRHDEQAIRILVDALVANAQEAMPAGGILTVQSQACVLEGDPDLGLAAGDYVRMTFRDSGQGLAPEVLPRIFEAGFTTKEGKQQKGVGLSLAIGQAIAWAHGGALTAEARPGQGATFHLLLPAGQATLPI
jgi:signal transduction histidine kinase